MNQLCSLSIRRPVAVLMVMLIVIILGTVSLTGMDMDLMPAMNIPIAMVMTQYTGAGPEEVEALVTSPVEGAVASVRNVEELYSLSYDGMSLVMVQFDMETDMNDAAGWLRDKIEAVEMALPEDAQKPSILQMDMNAMPILYLSLSSDTLSDAQLQEFVTDRVQPRLERQEGVASVSLMGASEQEILVECEPARLQGLGLNVSTIAGLLASENINQPGGNVAYGDTEISISSQLKIQDIEEVRQIRIPLPSGQSVALGDIADVRLQDKEVQSISRRNGEPSLMLTVTKASDANTVATAKAAMKEVERLERTYEDFHVDVVTNQADFIQQSILGVLQNIFFGALFAILILFVFLKSVRLTGVIAVSMPISIIATFVLMYFSGSTLNIVSLGGLSVGVGMLVDNSIVVLESIYRYRTVGGMDAREGTERGTREVIWAIIGSTMTTVVIFVPFVFASGMVRSLFGAMAWSVVFSLFMSLLAAVTVVPMMSANFVPSVHRSHFSRLRFLNHLMSGFDRLIKALTRWYQKALGSALRHKKLVILTVLLLFVGSLVLGGQLGAELIPATDEGVINITVSAPQGTTLTRLDELTRQVEAVLQQVPEAQVISTSMSGGGMESMLSGGGSQASISLSLIDKNQRQRSTEEVAEAIRQETGKIAGADIGVSAASSIMGGSSFGTAGVSITIEGSELDEIQRLSDQAIQELSQVSGLREVTGSMDDPARQVAVRVDRQRALAFGLTGAQVASQVRTAITGTTATTLKVDGTETDIRLAYPDKVVENYADLGSLPLQAATGQSVPLSAVADISLEQTPATIMRVNQTRYATVSAEIYGRDLGSVSKDVQKVIDGIQLPVGYTMAQTGTVESMEDYFLDLFQVIGLAVLLVYMVMAAQFESLLYPFIIMFTIPLALMGVFAMLFITGENITMISLIGILVLVGIVVNNGIVLIDYIGTLRRRDGLSAEEAVKQACPVRLRPILMTALTTILGQLPIILSRASSSEMLRGMGWTVIGGLLASTVLTLVVVPILYLWMTNLSDRRHERRRRRRERRHARLEREEKEEALV